MKRKRLKSVPEGRGRAFVIDSEEDCCYKGPIHQFILITPTTLDMGGFEREEHTIIPPHFHFPEHPYVLFACLLKVPSCFCYLPKMLPPLVLKDKIRYNCST